MMGLKIWRRYWNCKISTWSRWVYLWGIYCKLERRLCCWEGIEEWWEVNWFVIGNVSFEMVLEVFIVNLVNGEWMKYGAWIAGEWGMIEGIYIWSLHEDWWCIVKRYFLNSTVLVCNLVEISFASRILAIILFLSILKSVKYDSCHSHFRSYSMTFLQLDFG